MKKLIFILGSLLVIQLVLAVAVNVSSDDYGAFQAQEKLLAFDRHAVDGLRIEDDKNSVVLNKRDGKWLLPESADFPANTVNVERLLDTLAGLEKGWPVATTTAAAHRFKVADDGFERKLNLLSNGKPIATLYVGTSPGFRKVHVRADKDDAVYAVAFNTWDANANTDDWIDKDILALVPGDIKQVESTGFSLHRDNDTLQLANLSDKEATDEKAADTLVEKLAQMRIQSVLGVDAKPEYQQDKPELEFKLTRKDGSVLSYRISEAVGGGYYVVKRSDLDNYFKVADYSVEPLKNVARREKLVKLKFEQTPEQASTPDNASAATAVEPSETNN